MLTFVLQAPLPVSLELHLAQVLDALVLQQSSFSLQLTERGLHFLSAAHLREREQSELRSFLSGRVEQQGTFHSYLLVQLFHKLF